MCAAIQELHSDCEIHFSKHNKHFYFRSLCVHKLHSLLLHKKTANANTNARMEIFTVTMCSLSLISSSLLFLSNLIFYDNDSELSWCVVWPTCDATGRSNQHPNSDWVMKTFAAMLSLIRHVTVAGKFAGWKFRVMREKPPLSRLQWPSDERPTALLICWHNISVSVHFKVNDYR